LPWPFRSASHRAGDLRDDQRDAMEGPILGMDATDLGMLAWIRPLLFSFSCSIDLAFLILSNSFFVGSC
jgi:hypothetical protein